MDNIKAGIGYHIVMNSRGGKLYIEQSKDQNYDHFIEQGPFIASEAVPFTPLMIITTEATKKSKSPI